MSTFAITTAGGTILCDVITPGIAEQTIVICTLKPATITSAGDIRFPHLKSIDDRGGQLSLEGDLLCMFAGAPLDCDVSKWDVSDAYGMRCMFQRATRFRGTGLKRWDVSGVRDMSFMFRGTNVTKKMVWARVEEHPGVVTSGMYAKMDS